MAFGRDNRAHEQQLLCKLAALAAIYNRWTGADRFCPINPVAEGGVDEGVALLHSAVGFMDPTDLSRQHICRSGNWIRDCWYILHYNLLDIHGHFEFEGERGFWPFGGSREMYDTLEITRWLDICRRRWGEEVDVTWYAYAVISQPVMAQGLKK
ncbi:hypothetical protein B484DRAFT_407972 [Ochromonadaceae sp. CCMP2298]|nr:hypothetical protein B484DRAFT_407972 [Ochromonadaceae sp. CCMP2298]